MTPSFFVKIQSEKYEVGEVEVSPDGLHVESSHLSRNSQPHAKKENVKSKSMSWFHIDIVNW